MFLESLRKYSVILGNLWNVSENDGKRIWGLENLRLAEQGESQ